MLIFLQILIQIILQLLGFTLLSLSLQRHYNDVFSQAQRLKKNTCILLRCMGFTMIVVAVVHAINTWGNALGLVYAFATASLVASALAVLFAYTGKIKAIIN
ncbi:DUF3325 domain-containing protein [Pseudoalteromonas prydzensis]|uniref:DUF3325 domain-containing protein n=1 Tax=Pseudoalteromonas prydzensis TaxID=182141 RepID=UPI0007E4DF40|nr:DUF3325 domain-containing protein [Pseudoalteromonas prydzensis]MBE0380472.1 hypothetical protein [Pseudoalteromonas prydzensis ACAM 620]